MGLMMDVFQIPIIICPEPRKTLQAGLVDGACLVKLPQSLLSKKKLTVVMVDQLYWRLLGKLQAPSIKAKTSEINRLYFGFSYKDVRYHRQFRRWGSCSSLKNINLSHRLIGAPEVLVNYVITHELAHLKYFNHSKEFWNLLRSTRQDPKAARKEINVYGRYWQNRYQRWYRELARLI